MRLLILLICLFTGLALQAQLVLQVEKRGSPKTQKFFVGQKLSYKIKDEKGWFESRIVNIVPKQDLVVLEYGYLHLDDFQAIRKRRGWVLPFSAQWVVFGSGWTIFSIGSAIADPGDRYTLGDMGVGLGSFGLGWLIQKLFLHKKYQLGNKHRLRTLDLNIVPFD